jgi:hypothetical protein
MTYIAASETPGGIAKHIYWKKQQSSGAIYCFGLARKAVTHIPNKREQLIRYYGFTQIRYVVYTIEIRWFYIFWCS